MIDKGKRVAVARSRLSCEGAKTPGGSAGDPPGRTSTAGLA